MGIDCVICHGGHGQLHNNDCATSYLSIALKTLSGGKCIHVVLPMGGLFRNVKNVDGNGLK